MTGRIKTWNFGRASGLIEAENGVRVPFELAAVLAYDVAHLSVGQLVTFIMPEGMDRKASSICLQKTAASPSHLTVRKEGVFRYDGFDQANAVRTFRYQRTFTGETPELFTVSTDLALLAKHHITFQEVPALCLRLLTLGVEDDGVTMYQRALTEQDMLSHIASRPGSGSGRQKRTPPRPVAEPALP
jgi:cold shock CspA family protein